MDRRADDKCRIELRRAADHGATALEGLAGIHHFCFADFQRADRMDWGPLRAFHEYSLAPGAQRPPSFHSGLEILTLVSSGKLRRTGRWAPREPLAADSAEHIHAGIGVDLGVVSVGDVPARYTEIWVTAPRIHGEPRRTVRARAPRGMARPIASNRPTDVGSFRWETDARVARTTLSVDAALTRRLAVEDRAYVVLRAGRIEAGGIVANPGDALAIAGPGRLRITALLPSDFYWIRGRAPEGR